MNKGILIWAISLILSAIILGAFGAHLLEKFVSIKKLSSFEVGVKYQMYHGIALLIIAYNYSEKTHNLFFKLVKIGVLLFSVSIYLLTFSDIVNYGFFKTLLIIATPLGGSILILAWFWFLIKVVKLSS